MQFPVKVITTANRSVNLLLLLQNSWEKLREKSFILSHSFMNFVHCQRLCCFRSVSIQSIIAQWCGRGNVLTLQSPRSKEWGSEARQTAFEGQRSSQGHLSSPSTPNRAHLLFLHFPMMPSNYDHTNRSANVKLEPSWFSSFSKAYQQLNIQHNGPLGGCSKY